jgi:murein DD-endopeptidase MepM/ murein hydrolase activator NlpD
MKVNDRFREVLCCLGLSACMLWPASALAQELHLKLPVACEVGRTCFIQNYVDVDPSPSARDHTCGTLTYNNHNGTDFRLPSRVIQQKGVNVLAAAGGRVRRIRDGLDDTPVRGATRDGISGIECGNGVLIAHPDDWETQYCHMAKGSLRVKPGQTVSPGQALGQIGLSGLTEYSHLHFTVRHQGKIVDPFAYQVTEVSCGSGGDNLWDTSLRGQLSYRERSVLNSGFTTVAVTSDTIENGEPERTPPSVDAPAIVAFIRAIGLKTGDEQLLTLNDPAGRLIAENRLPALETNKAQYVLFAGRKRPSLGWDRGTYTATYVVQRNGRSVLEKRFAFELR